MRRAREGLSGMRACAALGVLLTTAVAGAQTEGPSLYLKNNSEGVIRGPSYESSYLRLSQFNRQNCLADETVVFHIDIRGSQAMVAPFHMEAWAGTRCDDVANRSSGVCIKVGEVGNSVERMDLFVRDLTRSDATTDADSCASESEFPTDRTLYFMLLNADGEPPPGSQWFVKWPFTYDLAGPGAPTMLRASPAAGGLHLSWEHPDAPIDLRRYVFLCDPPPDADPAGDFGPNEFCESTRLWAGEVPTVEQVSSYMCGYTDGVTTSADVTPLSADVTYAVGIVAMDSYYNVGPVSDTACEVPDPPAEPGARTVITDRGCALGGRGDSALGPWLVAVGIGAMARRRGTRRRRWRLPVGADTLRVVRSPEEWPSGLRQRF